MDAVTRALVNRETTGIFKIVADSKSIKVPGVHIVAENAGDVIYAATLVVEYRSNKPSKGIFYWSFGFGIYSCHLPLLISFL